jgi:hypothetical protein
MIKKKGQMKIAKAQKKIINSFIESRADIISAISYGAVEGFSRGVAGALGVPLSLCLVGIKQARLA